MSNKQNGIVTGGRLSSGRKTGAVVNVGYGNFVTAERIVAILETGSLPMKRLREQATESGFLIDATAGRKMRSLIVTDSNHVVVSALAPQTLQERLQESKGVETPWKVNPAVLEREDGEFVS